jgi:spoIIIJ-associated protein
MEIDPLVEVEEGEDIYKVDIQGDDLSFLIGYRGESLNALQTLLGLMMFRELGDWTYIVVDINGYRDRRRDKIEEMTRSYIDKARFFGKEIKMPPMNAYERRQVHVYVSDYPDIESESEGEGRARRVVLKVKTGA